MWVPARKQRIAKDPDESGEDAISVAYENLATREIIRKKECKKPKLSAAHGEDTLP